MKAVDFLDSPNDAGLGSAESFLGDNSPGSLDVVKKGLSDIGLKLNIGTTVDIPEQVIGINDLARKTTPLGMITEAVMPGAVKKLRSDAETVARDGLNARRKSLSEELSPEQKTADAKSYFTDEASWANLAKDGLTAIPGKVLDLGINGKLFGDAWSDWRKPIGGAAESFPGTLVTMGPTAKMAGGIADRVFAETLAKTGSEAAAKAAATKAAENAAMVAGGLSEGLQGAGSANEQTRRSVMEMPIDKLQASPYFQQALKANGGNVDAARTAAADQAATTSAGVAFLFDSTFGALGDRYIGTAAAGNGSRAGAMVRGGIQETPTEFIQSGGEKFGENLGIRQFADPSQPLMKDVGEEAVGGAMAGGLTGVAMGGAMHRNAGAPVVNPPQLPDTGPLSRSANIALATTAAPIPSDASSAPGSADIQQESTPDQDAKLQRLAELELQAEQRALTPAEVAEAQGIQAAIDQADNSDSTVTAEESASASPVNSVSAEAITSHAYSRLAELELATTGTKEQIISGPDGKPMAISGEQPRYFTQEEQAEYKFLKDNAGNLEALAKGYGVTLEAPSTAVDPVMAAKTDQQLKNLSGLGHSKATRQAASDEIARRASAKMKQADIPNGDGITSVPPASGENATAQEQKAAPVADISGQKLTKEWTAFSDDSGSLGIPRAEMPQIKSEHRGAMTQFMNARGISHQQEEVPADSLKPTQAEFSLAKVELAAKREGGDRSILVSSDNYVLDGHHQWLAKRDSGDPIKIIRLNAPINDLIGSAHEFPSSQVADGALKTVADSKKASTGPASRDDLLGAILRVTGNKGIAANMAQTIVGDKANQATKVRGLFQNQGTMDLDDTAELLRTQEGYDVRDGNHLAELIRQQADGSPVYSMARNERDAAAVADKQHRDEIRRKAKKLGVKQVARQFSDIEQEVIDLLAQLHDEAVAKLDTRARARYDAMLKRAVEIADYDELDAIITDAQNRYSGRQFYNEAAKQLRGYIDDLVLEYQAKEQVNASEEDPGTTVEPDWLGSGTEGFGGGRLAATASEGAQGSAGGARSQGSSEQEGLTLTGQTNEQAAEQFARQQAGEPAEPTKEQADRERDVVPFSMQQQSQPKPQGVQGGLFTADGRATKSAAVDAETNETERGTAIYNVTEESIPESEWLPDSQITTAIDPILNRFGRTSIPVRIIEKLSEAAFHGVRVDDDMTASGFVAKGQIFLVKEGLGSSDAVVRTMFHELFHYGLRRFMTRPQYMSTMQDLYDSSQTIRDVADAWIRSEEGHALRRRGEADGYILARGVDEALASVSEEFSKASIERRIIAKPADEMTLIETLSQWLSTIARQFGFNKLADSLKVETEVVEYGETKELQQISPYIKAFVRSVLQRMERGEAVADGAMLPYSDPAFMTAWHGSPHDHDGFTTAKIGTGEGAQAYGWGLYFASAREVAEHYRNVLSENAQRFADIADQYYGESDEYTIEKLRHAAKQARFNERNGDAKDYEDTIRWIESGRPKEWSAGKLYQVELAPSEDEYLDWDKPLSEQSEKVKAAISPLRKDFAEDWLDDQLDRKNADFEELTGGEIYKLLQKALVDDALPGLVDGSGIVTAIEHGKPDKAASMLFHEDGIRGIRYLDGTSRGAGEGSHNYVIFSDDDVSITAKFSRGNGGAGMALRDLQAVVDRVGKRLKNLPRVHALESPASLSTKDPVQKSLRDFIRKAGAWNDAEGATHEGDIYLFASGLADEARAEHVLAVHEVTHYGLRGTVGKDLDMALQDVWAMNAKVRRAAAELKERNGLNSNIDATEEILADMAPGDLVKLMGWRRIVKSIRDWLSRVGFERLAEQFDDLMKAGMSEQEKADVMVADLVNAARDWVRNGKGRPFMDGTRLADGSLSEDLAKQEQWLLREAKVRGFQSIDEMSEKDTKIFNSLTKLWREKHPLKGMPPSQNGEAMNQRTTGFDKASGTVIADFKNDYPMKAHADYKAAKGGDVDAAARLVQALVKPESIQEAKEAFGEDVIYAPVHAEEASGKNQIPNMLALHYSVGTGAVVDDEITQTNRAFHTGANAMERLLARSEFGGKVEAGRRYVLVDDVTTMGSTLADLASYIRSQGGEVAGSVVLVNAARSGMMIPASKTIRELEARHGDEVRKLFGVDPGALTWSEAQYLLGFRTTDELRNRVAKAEQERVSRLRAKGVLSEREDPQGSVDTHLSRANTPQPNPATGASNNQPPTKWQAAKQKFAELTSPDSLNTLVYNFQNKFVDLKNLQARIKQIGGTLTDLNDAYLGEEMYHGKVMKKTADFLDAELRPLLQQLFNNSIKKEDFETFLHARHAPEANNALAERNPTQAMIDAGELAAEASLKALQIQLQKAQAQGLATKSIELAIEKAQAEKAKWSGVQAFQGTEDERLSLSGMSDADAAQVMASIPQGKRATMDAAAAKVDTIQAKTLAELERYGLMDKASLDAWRKEYQYYIPLHRDEAHPDSASHPIGQGFSVKGDAAKRRTGSNEKVTNILGHIAMQREAAITRGEKNSVSKRLWLQASQNPDRDFWSVDRPPMLKTIDQRTGFVRSQVDPTYKNKPNVLMLRIAGRDAAIVFNERNPEAVRLAGALKNLDGQDLDIVERTIGSATRWFAAVNTQYNPIFGIINLLRDSQSGILNLTSTALGDKKGEVAKRMPAALKAIYQVERGGQPGNAAMAALWQEFQEVGGQTGYRDLYASPEDRVKALEKELKILERGNLSKRIHAVADWLSDYNTVMENGVRLAAYATAIDQGMSKERAASLAKNLTVNFNRKGAKAAKLGAFYAFFNASVQGTERLAKTIGGPAGRKILMAGVTLGVLQQALGMLFMGGGDDEEWDKIPDFVKERSLIFPVGGGHFVTIPMPLGFNVLPNIGRLATEWALGGKDKPTGKQIGKLMNIVIGSFNPLGGSDVVDMVSPTVADPVIALLRNKDWTGKPIYQEDMASLDPTPGFTRTKDSATPWSKGISYVVNWASGGTDYTPGRFSPTPDQIDYVIGQVSGGVGRELGKAVQTGAAITGLSNDELPVHKIPLAGRLVGSTNGPSGQSEKFYENIRELNGIEREIKGRVKDGKDVSAYVDAEPKSALVGVGNEAESNIRHLREQRRLLSKQGDTAGAKEIDGVIATVMKGLNMKMHQAAK